MLVRKLRQHVIEAVILDGPFKKEVVFIPRIPIITEKLSFRFKRLQFPVRLCFALTTISHRGKL